MSDGKLRKSQLLTSFGVGAIVEINDQSLMGMDISRWSPSITKNKKYRISPIPRLEKMLKKSFFISPPTAPSEIWKDASQTASIPYHRFPKWLECRKCNSLRNYQSQGLLIKINGTLNVEQIANSYLPFDSFTQVIMVIP